jgi:hypothetical protein
MNLEIGTESTQFFFWEYLYRIFIAVYDVRASTYLISFEFGNIRPVQINLEPDNVLFAVLNHMTEQKAHQHFYYF